MKITKIEPFILHAPVTRDGIADSTHQITHWGTPGCIIHTDAGITGYGYSGTHGHRALDKLIVDCITETYAPLLIGEDPHQTEYLWEKLYRFPPGQWVGRGGITHLALGAIDIALWDIKAKAADLPLWKLLGGGDDDKLEGYNTDGGWLNWTIEDLVADCSRLVEEGGYRGVKIKVGSPNPNDDLRRIEAVRSAIGPDVKLMVDANGHWDLPTAINFGRRFRDFNVYWFEEPIWYDDIEGHARLAEAIETPIALGEQLYLLDDFRNFLRSNAVHFVQPDCVRVAGVTEWWQVADLALAHRLPVVAHIGDMMQVHIHLAWAHRASNLLEYIPWMLDCFEDPVMIKEGWFAAPQQPGAGTTLKPEALEKFNVL